MPNKRVLSDAQIKALKKGQRKIRELNKKRKEEKKKRDSKRE